MNPFGRPSPAAAVEPPLRSPAGAGTAGYRADGGTTGWCVVRAATVAGVGHRLARQVNQDCYAWAQAGHRLAVAVADGLGSVPGSEKAAAIAACAAAVAAVDATEPLRDAALAGISSAGAALRGAEDPRGATTLVVGVAEPGGEIALSRVGDSTAFVVSPGGSWRELFAPPGDDGLVAVATGALSSGGEPARETAETADATLSAGEVLVMVSDGVAGPWRDGPSTVAPAMMDGILARPSPLALAELADFSRQGCHDDRTIVALWLEAETPVAAD